MLTRRQFIHRSATGLALPAFWQAIPRADTFHTGVIADSHVIIQTPGFTVAITGPWERGIL